jgi:blue copper oxidase
VMQFVPRGAGAAGSAIPAKLAQWEGRTVAQSARRRRIVLASGGMGMGGMGGGMGGMAGMASHGLHVIDSKPFDMARIDQRVRLGDVEIWEVTVAGMVMLHPFHIHGVHFEVLRRGGQEPVVEDQGRRDTVIVDEPVELLVHFTQRASEQAPFMYHCHILEHEDAGMMGQFTVG